MGKLTGTAHHSLRGDERLTLEITGFLLPQGEVSGPALVKKNPSREMAPVSNPTLDGIWPLQ